MNDTLAIKPLLPAQIGASQLDSTAKSFPRVASSGKDHRRQNNYISSVSPTILSVAHQPRTAKSSTQRSFCYIEQSLARLDAQSNVISTDAFKVGLQCVIPSGVTLAEFRAAAMILFGALLEGNSAMLDQLYYGEY